MSDKALVARIGQVATSGKHKDRFLYVGTIEPKDTLEKFFYLIEIDTPWVDGEKIKNTILSTIGENYQPGGKDKSDGFEELIKKINLELGDLSQAGEHEWIGKLNAIIGLSTGRELIFSQTGKISGYLFRGNKISHITEKPLENEEVHPLKTFISVINGNVADNDKVIIGNNQLYSHLSLDRLRQILSTFKYKDAIAEIVKILRRAKVKDANLMVFDFQVETEAGEETEEKPAIILLDDIPDSPFIHYSKLFFRGVGWGAKASGRGLKKAGEFWAKNVAPKVSTGAKNLSQKTKTIGRGAFVTASEKVSAGPKINYFGRTISRQHSPSSKNVWQNLLTWFKKMLQPENRKYLYIGLIVILLAIGLIKITINNHKNTSLKSQGEAIAALNSARSTYTKALDDLATQKPAAKDELIQARNLAQKATSDAALHEEATNLLNQIQVKLDEQNSAVRIPAGKEPNFTLSGNNLKIIAIGANIYLIDSDGKISNFDSRNKNITPVVTLGNSDGKAKDLTFSDNSNSIYIYTDASKVKQLNLSNNTLVDSLVTDTSGKWENSVAISVFSTNLYLLDAEAGQIWKHTAGESGYAKGAAYVTKLTTSIKGAVDLAIDGDVYVLQSDGSVVRVKKSVIDPAFKLNTPPTPDDKIAGPQKIYAGTDSSSIYILDKAANRVLQYSKTGAYQKQFVLDGSLPLTDFALNGKLKKLWLISENKVFEINL